MQPPKPNYSIDSVLKFFSIMYILLITLGLTYNYFLYRKFGILITQYIDIGEGILLFIPLLTDTVIISCLFICFMYFSLDAFFNQNNVSKEAIEEKKRIKKMWTAMFFIFGIACFVFLILGALSVISYDPLFFCLTITIVFFIPLILELILDSIQQKSSFTFPQIYKHALCIFIMIAAQIILKGHTTSEKIKRRGSSNKFEIIFKDGSPIFKSDSSTYYLGRTKNYVFIYNFNSKMSSVLNVSDIREFKITNPD